MNKSMQLEQDSDEGRGSSTDMDDQSDVADGAQPLLRAPIPISSSSDGRMTENQIPSSYEVYNDYADAKESDVPNLVPSTHRIAYEAFYGDMENTTATSIISDSNSSQTSLGAITSSTGQDSKNSRLGGSLETFPMKLYRMLAVIEDLGYSTIISWKPHGRAFQVNDVDQFVKLILPKFFRQSKITSFQRQLNLYGFKRFLNGPDNGAYYHELFLREKTFLCKAIFRTKVKGKTNKRRKAAELLGSEPDFYQMKTLSALNPEDRKLRLQSFFDTEEDLGYFTTFLSTVVVEKKNEPKKKRGKKDHSNSKTTSTGKRKRKDVLIGALKADYNLFEDRQSSSNDDADDEKEEMTGAPLSSRRKVASKKRDLHRFGFFRDSIASAPNQQLQEVTSERSLKPHQGDRSRESSADASLQRRFPSLSTSRSSSNEIAHPSAPKNIVHTQINQPRISIIDLVPTPIPIIQQNEHAYFRMMLIDDDFKNLFHNLLKS